MAHYDNLQQWKMRPEAKLKTSGSPCCFSFYLWMTYRVLWCWTNFVLVFCCFLFLFLLTIIWLSRAQIFPWIHPACTAQAHSLLRNITLAWWLVKTLLSTWDSQWLHTTQDLDAAWTLWLQLAHYIKQEEKA